MSGTIDYRFTIANPAAGTPFTPGDLVVDAAHWQVTSLRGGTRPYIPEGNPVRIDGQEVDLITGKVTDGTAVVRVMDLEGTTGGGVAVNEEFGDSGVFARWASNYASSYGPAGNWGLGFIEYPAVPPQATGLTLGGSPNQNGADETWLSRVFTGLTPLTSYTVQLRYFNRGAANVLGIGPIGSGLAPFLRVNGVVVYGSQRGAPVITPPNNPPAEYLTVQTTSNAAGEITVDVGTRAPFNMTILSFAMGFDWVHITPGDPAVTGRYSTINLADLNARQQVIGRQAYIEASYDRGVSWPHCLHSGYITDIRLPLSLVYEYSVGDTRRTERITKAFVKPTTHFDNITCLIGGPTLNGWLPFIPFYGKPRFEIEGYTAAVHDAANALVSPGEVVLKYTSGPMPEGYKLSGDNLTRENFDIINERARSFWVAGADGVAVLNGGRSPVNNQRLSIGSFPRLVVEIDDINGDWSTGVDTVADKYTPLSWIASPPPIFMGRGGRIDLALFRPWPDTLLGEGGRIRIAWPYNALFVQPPQVGGFVNLAVYARDISEQSPLHIAMHPVDIVRYLYEDYGIAYDTTSYQATKEALGSQLKCYLRVKAAENIQSFIEKLSGCFGFSTRVEDGERVFFVLRRKSSNAPSVSITDATLREEGGPTFELGESTRCNQVRVKSVRYLLNTREAVEDRPWDEIAEKEQTVVADLVTAWAGRGGSGVTHPIGFLTPQLDASTFGERPVDFEFPGQLHIDGVGELPFLPFARGVAESVFDRAGRGIQMATRVTRRGAGADDLQLGDEVADGASHNPNAQLDRTPSSQRGGVRTSTVVRKEEQPEGVIYTLSDAGTGTVPAGITPLAGDWDFSIDPLDDSVVIFDIQPLVGATRGFAADLVTANARIEIQIAFSAIAPTTDGIHLTTIDPAEYAHDASVPVVGDYRIRLGPFATTTALWARIRTFVPGTTPSGWTTWENVATGIGPGAGDISNLIVGTITDTTVAVSWTNTDTANPVTVYQNVDGVLPPVLAATLLPGSNQFTLTGLQPGTDYDITVILAATGTALLGSATTTNSGLPTLQAPINGIAFSGSSPNVPPGTATGIFGMRAVALAVPSVMIFEYADETSIGSNAPSTFREWTREPSVSGGYTVSQTLFVPNNGLLRFVRAKLRATGYNDSPYTSPIAIDPWLPGQIVPGNPIVSPGNPIVIPPGNVSPAPPGSIPTPVIPPPGSTPFRATAQMFAFGVASDAAGTGTIQTGRSSIAYRISSNKPVRVRLYETAAARTADAARADSVDSESGDGIALEAILTSANNFEVRFSPRIVLGSTDRPASGTDTLYYSLHNLSTGTEDIAVDLDLEILAT